MDTDLIRLMSNEALRFYARLDRAMTDIAPRHRFDAIDARKELARRDMIDTFGQEVMP